ncbi:polyprenyl synthetase family protein [Bacteroides coprosuis]|uniref:polyprenyl synthetase family protein n=1 Tax=Bacteroides coprosuis TaxID=151276 RepID=UPI001D1E4FE2|nr:polyprenyl synthetase family protein [Bacteroides coprosuis]HJD93317.1 polyprenyl synthetase family protein [Bacteroides coprosuis]
MKTTSDLKSLVNNYLKSLNEKKDPKNLYEPIHYVLSIGGKRIRPILMLLAYQLYKDDLEKTLPAACAIEVYHNFTLLHDDLMDKSDLRRNKPTVHNVWNANTAILSGDAMLILSYHLLAKAPQENLSAVLNEFNKVTLEICEGQQYDIEFETKNSVKAEDYLDMIRLKTAVLLASSIKMGAIIAGASDEDTNLLYDFGLNVGLAFQLQDDYLDVYGDPKVFGKQTGDDIVSNKKTYMLIQACNRATGKVKEDLETWIDTKEFNSEKKIKAITEIYNELGIDEICKQKMNEYYDKALNSLSLVSVSDDKKKLLQDLAAKLMIRNI